MLFHVTITHSQVDCPGRRPAETPDLIGPADRLAALGDELAVTSHSLVWGASCILWAAPEHVAYALLDAPSLDAVERYLDVENRVVLDIVPAMLAEESGESAAPASPQRAGEPKQPAAPPPQLPSTPPAQPISDAGGALVSPVGGQIEPQQPVEPQNESGSGSLLT